MCGTAPLRAQKRCNASTSVIYRGMYKVYVVLYIPENSYPAWPVCGRKPNSPHVSSQYMCSVVFDDGTPCTVHRVLLYCTWVVLYLMTTSRPHCPLYGSPTNNRPPTLCRQFDWWELLYAATLYCIMYITLCCIRRIWNVKRSHVKYQHTCKYCMYCIIHTV